MDDVFYLFSEYRDEGNVAKHFICRDYHLWVWSDDSRAIVKFEFQYRDWRVKYSHGEYSHGSENYVMPMFFLLDQLFTCDVDMQARLLGIRDSYVSMTQAPGHSNSTSAIQQAI